MPKIGMEPLRRAALVEATVAEIGAAGSLDVTVSRIARRAGMSPALAHHYFGNKDQMLLAAMRHILREYSAEVRAALADAGPKDRLGAIIRANFAPSCFDPATVSAWLNFYVQAQTMPEAARLLRVYHRRLHTHLVHALRPYGGDPEANARTLGALIDGVYLRAALGAIPFVSGADEVLRLATHLTGACQ